MTAFEVPVASEGEQKLAMPDLPYPEKSLDTLLSVSLIEQYENQQWKTNEFLVSSLVRDWLEKQGVAKLSQELVQIPARNDFYYRLTQEDFSKLDNVQLSLQRGQEKERMIIQANIFAVISYMLIFAKGSAHYLTTRLLRAVR